MSNFWAFKGMFPINPVSYAALSKASVKLPDAATKNPVDFQAVLRESRMQMMGRSFLEKQDTGDSIGLSPGYQWILSFVAAQKGISGLNGIDPLSGIDPNPAQRVGEIYRLESSEVETPIALVDEEGAREESIPELVVSAARRHQIPEQLFTKLIGAESNFNPHAKSPKGAMGLGQLMPATAKEMGLRVNDDLSAGSVWHPASNLEASAKYLRRLHGKYADQGIDEAEAWKLAAGAYNAGMGNIQKTMNLMGEDGSPLTWEKVSAYLPRVTGTASRETLRYVGRLFA